MKTNIKDWAGIIVLALAILTFLALVSEPAYAVEPLYAMRATPKATITVQSTTDDGIANAANCPGSGCRLRDAIAYATAGDTIIFDNSLSGATIYLASMLTLSKDVIIDGSSLALQIIISGDTNNDGTGNVRVFWINYGVTATLNSLTITKGNVDNFTTSAGAIQNSGTLTIIKSSLSDNRSYGGGAIASQGMLMIIDSTFSNNVAVSNSGGAILSQGTLTVTNSTFGGNSSLNQGGAIIISGGTLTIRNSTFSGNSNSYADGSSIYADTEFGNFFMYNTIIANSSGPGVACSGTPNPPITVNNLVQDGSCAAFLSGDPKLDSLANNGGPTQTFALLPDSIAIDAGDAAKCPAQDQRGFPRNGNCDIGSYELQSMGLGSSNKSVSPTLAYPGTSLTYTIKLSDPEATNSLTVSMTDTLPATITYIGNSLTASSGSYGFASGVITWTGTLNATMNVSITFGATVNANVPPGNIVNTAVINGDGQVFTRTAKVYIPTPTPFNSYLPMVVRLPTVTPTPTLTPTPTPTPTEIPLGIHGKVTFNGIPISYVTLALRFYNGSTWSTFASTTTNSDGSYSFLSAPTLGSGQKYYVLYSNSSDPSRLFVWKTRQLTSYTASSNVAIGDFDVANISMVSPSSGTTVGLPFTFQWTARPATPSDSYEFNLYHSSGTPYWWTVPPLGYVSSYTLNSLPSGFNPGILYRWYMAVYSPDGGYGESYYYRNVMFSNTGLAPSQRLPLSPKPAPEPSQPRAPQLDKTR